MLYVNETMPERAYIWKAAKANQLTHTLKRYALEQLSFKQMAKLYSLVNYEGGVYI